MEKESKQGLATTGGILAGIAIGIMVEHLIDKAFPKFLLSPFIPLLFGVTGAIYGHSIGTKWADKPVVKKK